jgi:hypothetical protein
MAKRGRRRLDPGHVLTGAERSRRWRKRHPKPPPDLDGPPQLQTFAQLVDAMQRPEPPRPKFDAEVLIPKVDPPSVGPFDRW